MNSWVTLIGMGGTALTALGLFLQFRDRRPQVTGPVVYLLTRAVREAQERGHRQVTVTHLVLALLGDPDVGGALEDRGVAPRKIYEELAGLLPPRASPLEVPPEDVSPELEALVRHAQRSMGRARPRDLMRALLLSEHHDALRAAFEANGVTPESWASPSSRRSTVGSPPSSNAPNPGPYRGPPTSSANMDVVFWNDTRSTMEFVTEVLRSTFGIVEPDATRLVLTTDREGFAVVGTYEREQAELLAETATRLARKHGFPLLVTVEEPGRTNPSAVARWLLRRRSARVATVPTSRPPQPVVRPEAWADFSEALACPCCGEESMRYRKLADGLVCTSCGRSFTQDG